MQRIRPALVLMSLAVVAQAQGKIEWQSDLSTALALAKQDGKPLVACISMKGERVCDVIVAEHYSDPKLVKLSRHTINLFCSPHGTAEQRELEKRVRIDLLKKDADAWMVAPQHVFFTPDGELIWAVPYYITAGELEWTWVEAIRKHDQGFEWTPSDRTRAPARLAAQMTALSKEVRPPPTKAEIKAMLKEIKRGYGGYSGASSKLPVIVRSESSQAKKFVERLLGALDTGDHGRISILAAIAKHAPRSWWSVAKTAMDHDKEAVRHAAVDTMRQLRAKKAAGTLHSRWRKESSDRVRCALLRAMVACSPSDSRIIKLLPYVLRDYKEDDIRVHAAIAIASLESSKAVHAGLKTALADKSARVRSTAAWAIATRRDTALLPLLRDALPQESDESVKTWLQEACKVIEGGPMDAFSKHPEVGTTK